VSFDVEKIAVLSYLSLKEEEKNRFRQQFAEILGYVDQLQKLPMTAEEASAMGAFHVQSAFYELLKLDPLEKLRASTDGVEDEDLKSLQLTNEEATKNAPKASGLPNELLFEVPAIMES
jgi:Asp-tRNA(Asn)/Glu-tRNA(Gln) amidotransferase C subunit